MMSRILAGFALCIALIAGAIPTMAQTPQQIVPCIPFPSATGFTSRCDNITPTQGIAGAIFPAVNGFQQEVWTEPKKAFVDDFGGSTLNTINRWLTSTANGGAVATNGTCPGASCGATVMGTGTTANGQSFLQTLKVFTQRNPGYLRFQTNINLPVPGTSNQYLMWGFSNLTSATTGLSAANPCGTANSGGAAASFAFTTGGKLQAITCASGNLTVIADLSVAQGSQPVQTSSGIWTGGCSCIPQEPDTQSYKYVIDNLGDNIIWYTEQADGTLRRVAFITRGAAGPDINNVPVTFMALGGASPPAVSSTIQINQISVGDSAGNPISLQASAAGSAVSSLVLSTLPTNLKGVYANSTASGYLMIFNATAAPSNGATTAGTASGNMTHCVGPSTNPGIDFGYGPWDPHSVGITAVFSSTGCGTLTLSATAFIRGTVE